jgi:hypothetical protein
VYTVNKFSAQFFGFALTEPFTDVVFTPFLEAFAAWFSEEEP